MALARQCCPFPLRGARSQREGWEAQGLLLWKLTVGWDLYRGGQGAGRRMSTGCWN